MTIVGHFTMQLSHRLSTMKCVSVSWFICSLKNGEVGHLAQFSRHLYQNWWTSSHSHLSQIGWNKNIFFVCVSVSWFIEYACFDNCSTPKLYTHGCVSLKFNIISWTSKLKPDWYCWYLHVFGLLWWCKNLTKRIVKFSGYSNLYNLRKV